ncbi:MAG: uracil-DNA glycosylase [Burkholderiaceae bacterium]
MNPHTADPVDPMTALHSLHLDERQRAMLAAMGTPVWWPEAVPPTAAPEVEPPPTLADRPPAVATQPVTPPATTAQRPTPVRPAPAPAPQASPTAAHTDGTAIATLDWDALTHTIQSCQACGLCQGRQRAVPGMGHRQARWMIVGEAPGEQEDKQGLPFVGPAGQLLDAMLAAMGLTREADVYIANVIKCRPPHNRNPEPAEVAQCRPYLQRQIELVQPDLILALGRFAAQTLLAGVVPDVDKLPLGKLRGQVYRVDGRPVVVSYHPAYLLRSPAEKGKTWADLCLAMEALGHNPLAAPPQT